MITVDFSRRARIGVVLRRVVIATMLLLPLVAVVIARGGSPRRLAPTVELAPLARSRIGAAVVLATFDRHPFAIVADADRSQLLTFDLEKRVALAATPALGAPTSLVIAADGTLYASLRDRARIAVFRVIAPGAPLARVGEIATRAEPLGLALSPDGATLAVASGWGHGLEAFSVATRARTTVADLGREPRAVAIDESGRGAVVTHAVGSQVSRVDLATGKVEASTFGADEAATRAVLFAGGDQHRSGCPTEDGPRPMNQGFAIAQLDIDRGERFYLPGTFVNPGDVKAEPVQSQYGGRGRDCGSAFQAGIAVVDDRAGLVGGTSVPDGSRGARGFEGFMGSPANRSACLLPRAAVADPWARKVYVACTGSDQVIEYDARGNPVDDARRRWDVPSGPLGLAVWESRLVVWSAFDRILTVIDRSTQEVATLSSDELRAPTDFEVGRKLFHRTGDPRISRDGRACASCHPDGRDDGVTWSGPEGARQTPMLAGRLADTAPYGWSGTSASVGRHLLHTLNRLGGTGLDENATRALLTYLDALEPPPRSAGPASAEVERGKTLFASAETGCASCHRPESGFTDGRGHDVGSLSKADRVAKLDTPSLRFLGGSAPYFHDGRYASLRGLLEATDGTMGATAHLAPAEVDALIAYLETL